MSTRTEQLDRAARHVAMARAINDRYEGKAMPAEEARQMRGHLDLAAKYRSTAEVEAYLAEPQHKHDMTEYRSIDGLTDAWETGGDIARSGLSQKTITNFAAFVRGTGSQKAALVEDTDGQNLLPVDFAGTIVKDLAREGVMRGVATIHPTNRRTVDLGSVAIGSATWGKLELGDTAGDGLGAADKDTVTVWDLNALVKLGRDEMEDSDAGLVELIRTAVVGKLAEQEDDAFATGTGDASKQPLGIGSDTSITQKVTAAAVATYTLDDLSKLVYAVPGWARKNGAYFGNSDAEQAAALMKNSLGEYLWQPATADGRPATFRGYRWYTVDGLASGVSGAAGKPLFFGDMKAGYLIADRRRFTVDVLRERFIDEGKTGLLFTHRVGGATVRPKALAYYAV